MPAKKEKIAIIGAGIAGLGSAYFLHKDYDITVFEKDKQAGGHAHTAYVEENGERGSYFQHGFHEDAFVSALEVCRTITTEALWSDVK